jgi:hypothetical protein
MPQGIHYVLVRANMANGESAVTKTLIQVNKTPPLIRLVSPRLGERYNQSMEFTALVSDDVELDTVQYVLRKGDKALYAVPGFIQGLYFDAHFWGASFYDIGLGLTFFDDNVKLQVQFGQFTETMWGWFDDEQMRYGGNIFGLKLLANVFTLPFATFGGPDWDWLSGAIAIGANFSYFTETQSGAGTMMSALVGQIEFPKVTFKKLKRLRTYSLYTEFQLWFIPTDVDTASLSLSTVIPHITGGIRINLF